MSGWCAADKMNALDAAMFDALVGATERLGKEKGLRAVVLSGEGRAFCAGLDMGRFAAMKDSGGHGVPGAESRDLTKRTHGLANFPQQAVWGWRQLPVPVIAAIQGVAFGGGFQLALGADMRFLTPDARMSIMEIKWGLVPDMAGTPILATLVRDDILRELTYTGRIFSAQEALSYGLATRICDDPRTVALAIAREIAGKSPDAIRAAKRMLNRLSVDPGAGAARRIRRAAEIARQRQPARGGSRQYRKARPALCGCRLRQARASGVEAGHRLALSRHHLRRSPAHACEVADRVARIAGGLHRPA